MSQENVELARRLHRAFNARDRGALAEIFDPDVEWIPILAKLEGASIRGHEGVNRWLDELDRDWAEFVTDPQEFRDLGDVVLILGTWHARARHSGLVLDAQPGAWVAEVRNGRVVRQETFTERAEALEAIGLSE
jgi:ketosteroid isomerase-like protein